MSKDAAAKKLDEPSIPVELEDISSFGDFPKELLEHLKSVTQVVNFLPGDEILRQGELNKNLYLLISGQVEVFVDGGLVARMGRQGDLMGEMSVISRKANTATVIAATPVELFAIDSVEFQKAGGGDTDRVQHVLYRIFSTILIDKLRVTNQKAKQLEVTLEELGKTKKALEGANIHLEKKVEERTADLAKKTSKLEQKNAALTASHKKIEDLYSSRQVTFKKLEELHTGRLEPLKNSLFNTMNSADDVATREKVKKAITDVDDVLSMLKPITELFRIEQAVKNTKVLLAEPEKKQQVIAKMALGGSGATLDIVADKDSAKQKIDSGDYDILFLESSMIDLVEYGRNKSAKTKFVLVTSDGIEKHISELRKAPEMPNLVSRDQEDRGFTVKNIMTTVSKVMTSDIFGLEKYLTWGVDVKELAVTDSGCRESLIDQATTHFRGLGMRRSICDSAAMVIEELLMNAIYDAPVDENGKAIYNHLDRKIAVNLEPQQQGKMRFACDGMMVAVSVEDPFGALKGSTIIDYLDSCYSGRAGELNLAKGGAGRGLHQIVENSDLVIFNVAEGSKTEVIALFDVAPNKDKIKSSSFHYFHI